MLPDLALARLLRVMIGMIGMEQRSASAAGARIAVTLGLTAAMVVSMLAAPPGALAAATYETDPTTTVAGASVTAPPEIVSDGRTTFHSVVVNRSLGEVVVYRRSSDGGRTWTTLQRFSGDDGGARDARIAASGDHVAVAFRGLHCPPASRPSCDEVPYLVESRDGGASWGARTRLASAAFDVTVAVDGARTWVAWWRGGAVEVRATSDSGRTFAVTRTVPTRAGSSQVYAAAAGGVAVVAWFDWRGPAASASGYATSAIVARGTTVSPVQELPPMAVRGMDRPVAVADGRAHVVVDTGVSPARTVSVATADSRLGPGTFAAPVAVGPAAVRDRGVASSFASLAARRGLLALAYPSLGGDVVVATSTDHGASFSAPAPVAPQGEAYTTFGLAVAATAEDKPVARFDWTVPPRYVDSDADRLPDPANDTGDPAIDGITVDKIDMTVDLNGCASLPSVGLLSTITGWKWTVDGDVLASTTCRASFNGRDDVPSVVRLEVTDSTGARSSSTVEVTPRDLLVVSIGDSVASGEGNPHIDSTTRSRPGNEVWQDGPCHRSAYAGPALAARALEEADTHSSVTFVQLACSGAAVLDVPAAAGSAPDPGAPNDPDTGGLLDKYAGVEPGGASARPSQLAQLADLKGARRVDALTVSIGANDVKFSEVVEECMATSATDLGPCHTSGTRDRLAARLATLPARYDALAAALDRLGVDAGRVFLTEYFDAGSDDLSLANLRCILDAPTVSALVGLPLLAPYVHAALATGLVTDDEAAWARDYVTTQINAGVRAGASAHGWRYVGGIADRFARHGYCASDPWVVRIGQSLTAQGDVNGAFHPNRAGHQAYAAALGRSLRDRVLLPSPAPGGSGPLVAGDLHLLTATETRVVATALTDTGAVPVVTGARVLDEVTAGEPGEGNLVTGSDSVAAHRVAGAGGWVQYEYTGPISPVRARLGQLAVRRNASVDQVRVGQAPEAADKLVTGRKTVVLARVDASVAAPYLASVTTEVFASGGAGGDRDLVTTTQQVRLVPGRNDLLLPDGATFQPAEGETVGATVTVTDPPGAHPADEVDNVRSAADDRFPPSASTTRALRVTVVPVAVAGAGRVSCAGLARVTRRMADFLAAAVPVQQDGVNEDLSCATTGDAPVAQDGRGVLQALGALDLAARQSARDVMVGVVPDGWLSRAAGRAIGVAAPGLRAVLVENSAPSETLAHEYAHTVGLDHTPSRIPAPGARVATRAVIDGIDWMSPYTVERPWTGGATWDKLFDLIGGPAFTPQLPSPASGGVWVRGTVSRNPDGPGWVTSPATWVAGGTGAPSGPDLSAQVELGRLVVRQVGPGGEILAEQPVGLGAADGLYARGTTAVPLTGLLGFSSYVALDPAATSVRLVLDGDVVETRPVTAAPAVTVTGPAAGSVVGRGAPLTVTWTATDPDGDPLVADVLVSADAGVSWAPLGRAGAGQSSLSVPAPADLGGSEVRVRVIVSDGVRTASDDSPSFTVDGGVTRLPERIVFTRDDGDNVDALYATTLWTMAPDGTDQVKVPLPTSNSTVEDPTCAKTFNSYCTPRGAPRYTDPVWSPDGTQIAFASNLRSAEHLSLEDDWVQQHIWVARPDGSGLRRLTPQYPTGGGALQNVCPVWSPDGSRIAWFGYDGHPAAIWVADADGANIRRVLTSAELAAAPIPADWPTPSGSGSRASLMAPESWNGTFGMYGSCPRWSPDGRSLTLTANANYAYLDGATTKYYHDYRAALVVGADGSNPRFVSPRSAGGIMDSDRFASVSWLGTDLVVARETWPPYPAQPTTAAWRLDPATGAMTRLSPDRAWTEAPKSLKEAPDGSLYGTVYRPPTCVPAPPPRVGDICNAEWDLGLVDPDSGELSLVSTPQWGGETGFDWVAPVTSGPAVERVVVPPSPTPGAADAGGPYAATVGEVVDLDAGASTALAGVGGAAATVTWDLDGDGAFDDADGVRPTVSFPSAGTVVARVRVAPTSGAAVESAPVDVVVTAAVAEQPLLAPGADDPVPALPAPADVTATVAAGEVSAVQLRTVGDVPGTAFEVTARPDAARLEVLAPPALPTGLPTSSPDGQLLVRPPDGVRGSVTLAVRVAGTTGPTATVTLTVTGNDPPSAVDDTLTVPVDVATVLPASSLLGNDTDPEGGPLTLVAVSGMSGGGVVALDVEGRLVVRPTTVGRVSFSYVVADADGATATGRVDLAVQGPPAGPVVVPVPPGVPAGPIVVQVPPGVPAGPIVVPRNRSLTVSWGPPETDGGSPVIGYVVAYRVSGSAAWSQSSTAAKSLVVAGLVNGTTYEVRVAAVNARGAGPFTPAVRATAATVPGRPRLLAVAGRAGALDVTWAAPADNGGAAVTDYLLEYALARSGRWSRWPTGNLVTASSVTGLRPGTAYDVRVAAINAVGAGLRSAPVRTTVPASRRTVRPVVRKLPDRVRTLTAVRLLRTPGTPAAALVTRTPATCVARAGRVLFLDQPGTCRLVVVQAATVVRRIRTEVVRRGASASPVVVAQRTLTTRFLGDSSRLLARSRAQLQAAVPALRRAGVVAVYGYAASNKRLVLNPFAERLAVARAHAVAAFLRARGVTVVVVVGYGARRRVPGGLQANRRAVIGWLR